jgi:E3 SUMO-protein ligase PIAS1
VEQVSIEPNGNWRPVSLDTPQGQASGSEDGEDDDDLIEIQEPTKMGPIRSNMSWTPSSLTRTPPASSREQSITSASVRSSSSKRPASAVVDLTLSSDDDEPPRSAKRQSMQQSTLSIQPPQHTQSAQSTSSGQLTPLEHLTYPTALGSSQQQANGQYRPGGVSFPMPRRNDYPQYYHI